MCSMEAGGTAGSATGRRRIAVAILGVTALAVIVLLIALRLSARTEVGQLPDIAAGDDVADAAWADEKLQGLVATRAPDFLPHLDDPRPTKLHFLSWKSDSGPRSDGRKSGTVQVR